MGIRGVDYEALLKHYLRHLLDHFGEDYLDEALHLADAYPNVPPLEAAAFQDLLNEVSAERRQECNLLRRGIC